MDKNNGINLSALNDHRLRAVLITLIAYGFFAAGNAGVKAIGDGLPLAVILAFRFWLGLMFVAPLAIRHFGSIPKWFHTTSLKAHMVRAILGMICVVLSFYGYGHLPFGASNALFRITPLLMCALSGPLLKEFATRRQWLAVAIGFMGVLVIVTPGHQHGHIDIMAAAAMLLAALAAATSDLGMRDLAKKHHAMTITGWYFWLAAMISLPFAIYYWATPNLVQLGLLMLIAGSGVIGQIMLASALKTLSAPMIAPFTHTTFVWGFGLGFIIWQEIPDWTGLIGAALILAGCLISTTRQQDNKINNR